jgi:hypothetical protein
MEAVDQAEGNRARYCPNCHYPLSELGEYCNHCGQKFTTGKVTVAQLFDELFEAIFNFDSKIFKTLGAIFVPGKLTAGYFEGRHRRYVNPVRLFFALAVLLFAMISFLVGDELERGLQESSKQVDLDGYQAYFLDQLDTARAAILEEFGETPPLPVALDSMARFFEDTRRDSVDFFSVSWSSDSLKNISFEDLKISVRDFVLLTPDSLAQKYEVEGWLNQAILHQQIRLRQETGSFAQFLLGKFVWMILFMMPALALVLKLLYIRHDHYYVEHLIFSFHFHAFAFLILTVALLLVAWTNYREFVDWATLAAVIYLFFAMKRVYRQGWRKTFLKFFLLSWFYFILASLFFTLTLPISAFLF